MRGHENCLPDEIMVKTIKYRVGTQKACKSDKRSHLFLLRSSVPQDYSTIIPLIVIQSALQCK